LDGIQILLEICKKPPLLEALPGSGNWRQFYVCRAITQAELTALESLAGNSILSGITELPAPYHGRLPSLVAAGLGEAIWRWQKTSHASYPFAMPSLRAMSAGFGVNRSAVHRGVRVLRGSCESPSALLKLSGTGRGRNYALQREMTTEELHRLRRIAERALGEGADGRNSELAKDACRDPVGMELVRTQNIVL
jgi:hypothetical protein